MTSLLFEPYSLVSIAVRSFILLILTYGVAFVFRRRSAAIVHGIWTVGLAICLATPIVMSLLPSWNLQVLPPETNAAATKAVAPSIDAPVAPAGISPRLVTNEHLLANETAPAAQQSTVVTTAVQHQGQIPALRSSTVLTRPFKWPSLRSVLITIWAAGFALILIRMLKQLAAVRRKLEEASDFDNADWGDQRDAAAQLLGLRGKILLKRHSDAISPMVVGLFRPFVLLPDDAETWSRENRLLVLLHELAHVQRRDVLTQLMATLACAVYWFNPIVWWGAAQMRKLREIACDDAVITHSSLPLRYARTLLDVAKRYRCQPTSALAMARSSNVEGRIAAILSSTRSRAKLSARSMRALAAVAVVIAAIVGTCQLNSRAGDSTEQKTEQTTTKGESLESKTMQVRVLDQAGKPLSDARIHVSIWEMQGGKDYPNRNYITDEQGRAEIARPRQLRIMRMWPAKAGYVPQFVNFAKGKHEEGRLIPNEYDFRLSKGHRLSGRVVDEDGNPISNAKVQVRVDVHEPAWGNTPEAMISTWLTDSDFNTPTPRTDSNGRWSINNAPAPLEAGKKDYEFQLQVTHPNYAGDTRWGELQQQQGITTTDLRSGDATLTLNPGYVLAGRVTGPEGEHVTQGLVVWNDHPYTATGINETQIDESGHYKTKHLAAGKYPITVLAPGFAPWQQTIELGPEIGNLDIHLQRGHPIRIKFVNQAGQPIPDVYVGIGEWRGTEAIYNEKHPNVPDSGIPRHANNEGIYQWGWAPSDAVAYRFSAKGYAGQEVALVAKNRTHVIILAPKRAVVGTITDASTGKPIDSFLAMPVIVFRPNLYHTRTTDAKVGKNGRYELPLTGSTDPNDHYRVRFEAEGYRSAVSKESFGPLDGRATLDFTLQPALPRSGRVVDANGQAVENAMILEASATVVPSTSNGKSESFDTLPIQTDPQGNFQLHATTETVRVRAYHELGFAEKTLAPDESAVGEMKLQPWATISGRLIQAGRPVADEKISFYATVKHGRKEARFQDSFHVKTDSDGYFQFDRIPPISGNIKASLGPWRDSTLTSSESIPVKLNPGEHREVVLGGEGAKITGRVVATGRNNDQLSKQWSLNYLISRDRGVDYPKEAAPLSFDTSGILKPDWLRQPDFHTWVATRLNYFVKLSGDGQFAIHGVEPGEYDLVIQLYEQPAGCLVETIGEQVVPVTVTAQEAAGQLKIGDVNVQCRIGPRVGSDMRIFKFTDLSGRNRRVDDLQGRYVLLHAWATWCAPCIETMPSLTATVQSYADSPLTVVGLNVDEDATAAKAMVKSQRMDWAQNYLGPDSDLMRQLAISSVPAYYLIGKDGKLIGSANQWSAMEQLLSQEFDEQQ